MKKLKRQYHQADIKLKTPRAGKIGSVVYPIVRSSGHKHFSTKQEKSFYFLHQIECYGYPIKLRAARGRALADPWDDYPSQVDDVAKSWKHNSKRRSQYYR